MKTKVVYNLTQIPFYFSHESSVIGSSMMDNIVEPGYAVCSETYPEASKNLLEHNDNHLISPILMALDYLDDDQLDDLETEWAITWKHWINAERWRREEDSYIDEPPLSSSQLNRVLNHYYTSQLEKQVQEDNWFISKVDKENKEITLSVRDELTVIQEFDTPEVKRMRTELYYRQNPEVVKERLGLSSCSAWSPWFKEMMNRVYSEYQKWSPEDFDLARRKLQEELKELDTRMRNTRRVVIPAYQLKGNSAGKSKSNTPPITYSGRWFPGFTTNDPGDEQKEDTESGELCRHLEWEAVELFSSTVYNCKHCGKPREEIENNGKNKQNESNEDDKG